MPQPCRNSTVPARPSRSVSPDRRSHLPKDWPGVTGQVQEGQHSAYNQTRESFLGLHVIAGDFPPATLQNWLQTLTPNSGAGIWLVPFRGLPVSEVPAPLDLLYLDEDCHILESVEFFPTFRVSASCPPAASVLVLPPHSLYSSHTQAGDQLMLCPAEELEWRMEQMTRTGTASAAPRPVPARQPLGPILVREEARVVARSVPVLDPPVKAPEAPAIPPPQAPSAVVAVPEVQQPVAPLVEPAPQVKPEPKAPPAPQAKPNPQAKPWMDPVRQPAKAPLGKLGRWLFPDPPDPRKTNRLPVSGLVAHFFTGGAPEPHEVRDVSPTGLYVVTKERWYPGTVIRMTITRPDTGQAPSERSITVHARSVRWGNDGVGLEFLVDASGRPSRGQPSQLDPVDSARLGQFLKRLKDGSR